MSEVTEADREIAAKVVGVWKHTGDDLAEIIAHQLADERDKVWSALGPVMDLVADWQNRADGLDEESELRGRRHLADRATGLRIAATALNFALRQAAEDPS